MAGERPRPPAPFMNPRPRLNAEFLWECPVCHRPYRHPQRAADCACPAKKPPTVAAPRVRCAKLPMFDGHPLALTELAGSRSMSFPEVDANLQKLVRIT